MIRQFHCPQLPMFAVCRQPQAGARELLNIIGIDLEVTEVLFFDLVRSINCREPATGLDAEPALPREFWSTIAAIRDRAYHRSDDQIFRKCLVLGRIRIGDAQHIACIL